MCGFRQVVLFSRVRRSTRCQCMAFCWLRWAALLYQTLMAVPGAAWTQSPCLSVLAWPWPQHKPQGRCVLILSYSLLIPALFPGLGSLPRLTSPYTVLEQLLVKRLDQLRQKPPLLLWGRGGGSQNDHQSKQKPKITEQAASSCWTAFPCYHTLHTPHWLSVQLPCFNPTSTSAGLMPIRPRLLPLVLTAVLSLSWHQPFVCVRQVSTWTILILS